CLHTSPHPPDMAIQPSLATRQPVKAGCRFNRGLYRMRTARRRRFKVVRIGGPEVLFLEVLSSWCLLSSRHTPRQAINGLALPSLLLALRRQSFDLQT